MDKVREGVIWALMTDDEKRAILDAENCQFYCTLNEEWLDALYPSFSDHYAYRIKPKPKYIPEPGEVVEVEGQPGASGRFIRTFVEMRGDRYLCLNAIDEDGGGGHVVPTVTEWDNAWPVEPIERVDLSRPKFKCFEMEWVGTGPRVKDKCGNYHSAQQCRVVDGYRLTGNYSDNADSPSLSSGCIRPITTYGKKRKYVIAQLED